MVILKRPLVAEEQRAKDSEAKIIQAAEHGKELLEKNMALERRQRDFETVEQEKHELNSVFRLGWKIVFCESYF